MVPPDEGQLFGLYGYLVLIIFLALICILLYLFPDIRAHLPWHNFIESIKDTNADIPKSNTSENIPRSTNGVQLIQSKKNPTLRKRSIRKTTTTLSSTAKSLSPSSFSTKLSDKSSSFSSSAHSFNSIEDCRTVDEILKNEQNECLNDTNLCSVKQKPVASEQMMTTMTDKNIFSKDADTIASTIHEVMKTSSSKGSSTTTKSLKTKKSNPIHHESCKTVVESPSPLSSLSSSSTVPEPLNNSQISTPVPDTSVTPQALDTTGNDDGDWLCANIKSVRRRRRNNNNNNKDTKQLMSTDNNNDDVHIDDTKLEGHVLQPQPINLSSVILAEKNSQNKSNSTHGISSNDQQYLMTSQDVINSKTNENLEPDSSHQCVVECSNKTSSIIENIDSSLKKQSSTEHSLKDPSVPSSTTNITTTTTTTSSSNSSHSNNDPSLIVLHSTTIVTSKRKRRNIPNKKSTDEIIINNNESIESYSILCNENPLDNDNNSMLTVTTTNTTNSSSTITTNTNISTPIHLSMKRNLHKKHEDDENGFELIELPNTSTSSSLSSSAVESDELEMHSSSSLIINTTSSTTTTSTAEKSSLPQAPPDLLSHFPPLIKTDNGDPIAVTMEVELLEGGRHPQANKLLKSALSSNNNNNNNQITHQQEQSTDDYVGKTYSTSSSGNKTAMKRSKVRKAD